MTTCKRVGRPPKPVLDKIAAGTYRPSRDGRRLCAELGVATLAEAYTVLGRTYRPQDARARAIEEAARGVLASRGAPDVLAPALDVLAEALR